MWNTRTKNKVCGYEQGTNFVSEPPISIFNLNESAYTQFTPTALWDAALWFTPNAEQAFLFSCCLLPCRERRLLLKFNFTLSIRTLQQPFCASSPSLCTCLFMTLKTPLPYLRPIDSPSPCCSHSRLCLIHSFMQQCPYTNFVLGFKQLILLS